MLRKFFILPIMIILLIFCQGLSWAGQEIVVVQSIRTQPYEDAVQGFVSVYGAAKIKRIIISELSGTDIVGKINEIKPIMVLAIGMDALAHAKMITDIPIIYLMVLNPPSILSGEKNIYSVRMNIPPYQQLLAILDLLPATKKIGFLYNPDKTGDLAEKTREAAREIGTKLIAKVVLDSKNVPKLISEMKGQIDVFLMLPDLTVVTPETVEMLLLFSLENKIPIVTFTEKYVELGALMSVGIDAFDMGAQAGEMAEKILSEKGIIDIRQADARKVVIAINLKVAKTLGIPIDKKVIRKARIIN